MSDANPNVALASRSPRRIELLKQIIPDFEVRPSAVDEIMDPAQSPEENVCRLAREKALDGARRHKAYYVLGADTAVVIDGQIIGKPRDEQDARRILRSLSGRSHEVITGVAVVNPEGNCWEAACRSQVRFNSLTDDEINAYVLTGEPMDKAGAYAIQGQGAQLIHSHEGSFTNIVGLPLETTKQIFLQAGYRKI